MKILQVLHSLTPSYGGGTAYVVYGLSLHLRKKGHSVSVYTTDFDVGKYDGSTSYIESLSTAGIKVRVFSILLDVAAFRITPGLVTEARRNLNDFEVIHIHSLRDFPNIPLCYFAGKRNIPYIIDAHGSTPRTGKRASKWLFDLLFGYRILRGATRAIAETQLGVAEYERMGVKKDRIVLLYPPFPVEEYAHIPPRGKFRERFRIKEKHILLYLGRINRIKGVDFILRSFGRLRRGRDDVFLVIAGPDEGLKSELENLIHELGMEGKVLFTGFIAGEQKKEALVDASVMVQTSLYEQGLSWACIEALLCNIPIIVSQGTGAEEDVRKMGGGYVVEFGNEDELSQRLNRILDEPEEPLALAAKMRQYILENLSLSSKVGEYEKIYSECMEESGAKGR